MSYVNTIAELFLSSFPKIGIVSAEDYTLIAAWEKEGIPYEVVAQSIEEARTKFEGSVNINSISQLEDSIRQNFERLVRATPQ